MAVMDSRSMQQVVHFLSAFSLPGFDTPQQSGTGARPKAIMNATSFMRRNPRRSATRQQPTYAPGQAVRLKGNFGTLPKTAEIPGMLPPRGNFSALSNPQQRGAP